ncbi:MAG: hypothetical protein ABIJ50_11620 [Pseudomonadota bacterium]
MMMFTFSKSLLIDAEKVAVEMLKTGEKIKPIPFGKRNDTLFVSVTQDFVKGIEEIVIEGEKISSVVKGDNEC